MATALITTFYGIILANLVFYPIVGKLQSNSIKEINYNELILKAFYPYRQVKTQELLKKS